jgi:integrase
MIKIRYKKLASGKYSIYLDIYAKDSDGRTKRSYDFLGIYVNADYSKVKRIKEEDKEKIRRVQAIKAKRELESIDVAHGLPRKRQGSNVDLFFVIEEMQKKQYDSNTDCALKQLKRFANRGKLPRKDVDHNFIEEFWKYLLTQIHYNTAITYLKRLRSYINKGIKVGILTDNPFTGYKIPSPQDIERGYLTLDELTKLQNAKTDFNPVIRQAFLFACFTGLRFSDIKSLKWENINDNKIVLRQQKTFDKTGKIDYYPLTEQAKLILEEIKKEGMNEEVFFDLPNNAYVNVKLKEWAQAAGIKKNLHFHISRHTFGTLGITFGIDLYVMQKLLGHSTVEMTKHYAKIVDEKLKADVLKFPVLNS